MASFKFSVAKMQNEYIRISDGLPLPYALLHSNPSIIERLKVKNFPQKVFDFVDIKVWITCAVKRYCREDFSS